MPEHSTAAFFCCEGSRPMETDSTATTAYRHAADHWYLFELIH
jgi:hypothetical protein